MREELRRSPSSASSLSSAALSRTSLVKILAVSAVQNNLQNCVLIRNSRLLGYDSQVNMLTARGQVGSPQILIENQKSFAFGSSIFPDRNPQVPNSSRMRALQADWRGLATQKKAALFTQNASLLFGIVASFDCERCNYTYSCSREP